MLFIFFISLIIRAMMLRKAMEAELLDEKSVEDIFMELLKLRAFKVSGRWRRMEVSKKQRTIFIKRGIGVPVEPIQLLYNMGGI